MGGGRSYDLDACGRLGRRDERARKALRYTPCSLVSARAVHHSVSRWRRPAAGWGSHRSAGWSSRHKRELWRASTVERKKDVDEGVKIISAQNYAGVDTVLRRALIISVY